MYIIPTPIGNLSDISERAINILNQVDLIAAEDTRHSKTLMVHLGISTPLISLHEHNEAQRSQLLISRIKAGESMALISDAGTPLISDPGYTLVSQCRDEGVSVVPLPGPCALTTALSGSGLPTDKFTFYGFLPVKQKAKESLIMQAAQSYTTAIFYEAPRRILSTIQSCKQVLPAEHQMVLAKELTKRFECFISGNVDTVIDWLEEDATHQKGEFVLMFNCFKPSEQELSEQAKSLMLTLCKDLPPKKAALIVSEHYDCNKKALYQYALEQK